VTDNEKMIELAERVEAATGPDRGLNIAMLPLVGLRFVDEGRPIGQVCYDSHNHGVPMPNFTASLDAAMSLVGDVRVHLNIAEDRISTAIVDGTGATALSPALALCAAALRARASSKGTGV
jgi:hypothetical protein